MVEQVYLRWPISEIGFLFWSGKMGQAEKKVNTSGKTWPFWIDNFAKAQLLCPHERIHLIRNRLNVGKKIFEGHFMKSLLSFLYSINCLQLFEPFHLPIFLLPKFDRVLKELFQNCTKNPSPLIYASTLHLQVKPCQQQSVETWNISINHLVNLIDNCNCARNA